METTSHTTRLLLMATLGACLCPSAPAASTPAASAADFSQPAPTSRVREELLGCLLTPTAEADVGSPVIGVLGKVLVDRGDKVRKGQALAQLVDDVERASELAASQRFENRAEIAAAKSAWEFAQKKAERARDLFDKQFISAQALEQAESEARVAAMKYAQAQEQRVVAKQDLAVARAQLNLRIISSPFNGVVVDRYLSPGERVEQKAIVKVAQIDPLRVEVVAPATRFNTIKPGSIARVTPEMTGASEMNARVVLVDPVVDPASNTFRVRLELPNPGNRIPSGLRCKIRFTD